MRHLDGDTSRRSPARTGPRLTLAATAVAIALTAAVASLFVVVRPSAPPPQAHPVGSVASRAVDAQLTLASNGSSVVVPRSFLGISTEYWTTPVWAAHVRLLDRVFATLGTDGPLRLRIGGDSADRVAWAPTRERPEWVYELTPAWLAQVSRIVNRTHVKLILDLNLVTATPALAARWASTAVASLPRGSITAFEIGNEPDIYDRGAWRHLTAGPGAPPLPTRITAGSYARAFASYARALAQVAPGIPLLAPALAEPRTNFGWVTKLLHAPHPRLAGITAHQYPYSACARPGSPNFPTIPRILSEHATARMGQTALKVEHISDRAGLPLWLTEINSVTCGGTRGVSDTFATALWAPDALLELVRAGVESASVHVRADAINMAFSLTRAGLVAHPLLYGLVLFARTLGPGARLVPVRLGAPASLHLKAWAVRIDGGLIHVLLINKGGRSLRVRLGVPFKGAVTAERLLAPAITSTTHVTFAGQHLGAAGLWSGNHHVEALAATATGYVVSVPRYSAALITAHLRPGVISTG